MAKRIYDHWGRDGKELEHIVRYIDWNPVRAGLVELASASKIILGRSGTCPTYL